MRSLARKDRSPNPPQVKRMPLDEMHRAWCEEGEGVGKSDKESPVCARWRARSKMKSEL